MRNISRKEFIKAGVALPLALQSLGLRATAKKAMPPKRIIFICSCLGFYKPYFFPKKRGDLATSIYLKDMKTLDKMTVFQNLFHPGMETSNHDSEKSFLTGSPSPESPTFVNGKSLDQVLARKMGADTRFPFLNFSIYDRGWGISWNDRGSPIPPMHDEEKIFEKLFEEENLQAKKRQLKNDQNILDCLQRDMAQLRKKGSQSGKLDSYKAAIRDLEAQLAHERFWLNAKKPKVEMLLRSKSCKHDTTRPETGRVTRRPRSPKDCFKVCLRNPKCKGFSYKNYSRKRYCMYMTKPCGKGKASRSTKCSNNRSLSRKTLSSRPQLSLLGRPPLWR